jgi:hypothetical protein
VQNRLLSSNIRTTSRRTHPVPGTALFPYHFDIIADIFQPGFAPNQQTARQERELKQKKCVDIFLLHCLAAPMDALLASFQKNSIIFIAPKKAIPHQNRLRVPVGRIIHRTRLKLIYNLLQTVNPHFNDR